jgi:hypothetical protein
MSTALPRKDDPLGISECLHGKLDLLGRFQAATADMKSAFASGDLDAIKGIIQKRRTCMDGIDRADSRVLRVRSDHPAYFASLPEQCKTMIRRLDRSIRERLHEISVLDREYCTSAASSLDGVKQELMRAIENSRRLQEYGNRTQETPRFLDVKF